MKQNIKKNRCVGGGEAVELRLCPGIGENIKVCTIRKVTLSMLLKSLTIVE